MNLHKSKMRAGPNLVDEVAKDEAAANIGVVEEDRDLFAEATKRCLANRPPGDSVVMTSWKKVTRFR